MYRYLILSLLLACESPGDDDVLLDAGEAPDADPMAPDASSVDADREAPDAALDAGSLDAGDLDAAPPPSDAALAPDAFSPFGWNGNYMIQFTAGATNCPIYPQPPQNQAYDLATIDLVPTVNGYLQSVDAQGSYADRVDQLAFVSPTQLAAMPTNPGATTCFRQPWTLTQTGASSWSGDATTKCTTLVDAMGNPCVYHFPVTAQKF